MQEPGITAQVVEATRPGTSPEADAQRGLGFSDSAGEIVPITPTSVASDAHTRPLAIAEQYTDPLSEPSRQPEDTQPLEELNYQPTEFQIDLTKPPFLLKLNCVQHLDALIHPPEPMAEPATEEEKQLGYAVARGLGSRWLLSGELNEAAHNAGMPEILKWFKQKEARKIFNRLHRRLRYQRHFLEQATRSDLSRDAGFISDVNVFLDQLSNNQVVKTTENSIVSPTFFKALFKELDEQNFINDDTDEVQLALFLKDLITLMLSERIDGGIKGILTQADMLATDARIFAQPAVDAFKQRAKIGFKGAMPNRLGVDSDDGDSPTGTDVAQAEESTEDYLEESSVEELPDDQADDESTEILPADEQKYLESLKKEYGGFEELFKIAAYSVAFKLSSEYTSAALRKKYAEYGLNDENVKGGLDSSIKNLLEDARTFVSLFHLDQAENKQLIAQKLRQISN